MLEFRLLNDEDIPLVQDWLNRVHVKRWYEISREGVSIDDWIYELNNRHEEFKWLTHLIVLWSGQPIGLCQYYKCEDSKEENFGTLPIKGSYGIDYLIGEEEYLKKGIGKQMITLLVDKILTFPDAQRVTADINKDNKASERTLLSCGFVLLDPESSRYVLNNN